MRVQTKGGHHDPKARSVPRLGREAVRSDLEESLRYLKLDRIWRYFLHRDNPAMPAAEILETLVEAQAEGLIESYGLSNWTRARFDEALAACAQNGWPAPVANQPEWNLARRNPDSAPRDLVCLDADFYDWHHRTGILLTPYSAQAQGYFEPEVTGGLPPRNKVMASYDNPQSRQIKDHLQAMAADLGVRPTAVALALLLSAPFPVCPLIGPLSVAQLRSSLAALALRPAEHPLADVVWRLATGRGIGRI